MSLKRVFSVLITLILFLEIREDLEHSSHLLIKRCLNVKHEFQTKRHVIVEGHNTKKYDALGGREVLCSRLLSRSAR